MAAGRRCTTIVAIIPAKGNSARLPRKNLRPFCGLPLVEWTFIAAQACAQIQRIICVTESKEIAEIAQKYDADIVWQTQEEIDRAEAKGKLGGLFAMLRGMTAVMSSSHVSEGSGPIVDDICVTMLPTSPLRKPNDIDNMLSIWNACPCHWVMSVTERIGWGYYMDWPGHGLQMQYAQPLGCEEKYDPKEDYFAKQKRLASTHYYQDNASIGVGTAWLYREGYLATSALEWEQWKNKLQLFYPQRYVMETWQQYDIDTQEHFELCEYWMEKKVVRGRGKEAYTCTSRQL